MSDEYEHVIILALNIMDSMGITFYILYIPEYPMGIGMEINFENSMGKGVGMKIIFENGYGCKYSYTRPAPIPTPHPHPPKRKHLHCSVSWRNLVYGNRLLGLKIEVR